jgi:hypothetical protein
VRFTEALAFEVVEPSFQPVKVYPEREGAAGRVICPLCVIVPLAGCVLVPPFNSKEYE